MSDDIFKGLPRAYKNICYGVAIPFYLNDIDEYLDLHGIPVGEETQECLTLAKQYAEDKEKKHILVKPLTIRQIVKNAWMDSEYDIVKGKELPYYPSASLPVGIPSIDMYRPHECIKIRRTITRRIINFKEMLLNKLLPLTEN